MATSFSTKKTNERIYLGFDFTKRLDVGETITVATFTLSSVSAQDSAVASMLSGSSIILGAIVKHLVINGTSGNVYDLAIAIQTSGGRTLAAEGQFQVS